MTNIHMINGLDAQIPEIRAVIADKTLEPDFLLWSQLTKRLESSDRQKLAEGKLDLVDSYVYLRGELAEGKGLKFLLDNKRQGYEEGVSNFMDNKLQAGQNILVRRIRLAYGKDVAISNPAAIRYRNDTDAIPAALLNGYLAIKVDKHIKARIPFNVGFNQGGTYSSVPFIADCIHLRHPFFIIAGASVEIFYEFPDVAFGGTDKHFLEVIMNGPGSIQSGA